MEKITARSIFFWDRDINSLTHLEGSGLLSSSGPLIPRPKFFTGWHPAHPPTFSHFWDEMASGSHHPTPSAFYTISATAGRGTALAWQWATKARRQRSVDSALWHSERSK